MDMKWNGRKYEMGVWRLRFWLVGGMKVKVGGGRRMRKGLTLKGGWEEKVGNHEWEFAILWINSEREKKRTGKKGQKFNKEGKRFLSA